MTALTFLVASLLANLGFGGTGIPACAHPLVFLLPCVLHILLQLHLPGLLTEPVP